VFNQGNFSAIFTTTATTLRWPIVDVPHASLAYNDGIRLFVASVFGKNSFSCGDYFSVCNFWPASPSTDPLLTYPLTSLIPYYYAQSDLQELYMSYNLSTPKDNLLVAVFAMNVNSIFSGVNLLPELTLMVMTLTNEFG